LLKINLQHFFNSLQYKYIAFLVFSFFCLASSTAFANLGASVTLVSGQPTNINPGATTELQITLSNSNSAAAITSLAFSNNLPGSLPNGLSVNGATTYTCTDPSNNSTSAGSGVLTATSGTQAISLSGGVIPAHANSSDGTCTIIIPVTSGAGTSSGGSATFSYVIANGAVTGNDGGAVANAGSVSQSINVNAISQPTITKTFGVSTVVLGGPSTTLTITVSNPNSIALPNFSVTDSFPQLGGTAIIDVAATPNAISTCSGVGTPATFTPSSGDTSLSATGGTVAANGSCTISVAVAANQTNGAYQTNLQTNTISKTSNFSNDFGISAAANATAQINVQSPLRVSKSFGVAAMASGQTETLTITFTNTGPSPLDINSFTDSPIDGLGGGRTYDGGGNLTSGGLQISGVPLIVCSGAGVAGAVTTTANNLGITQTSDTTVDANGTCTITASYVGTVQSANTPVSYTNTIAQGTVGNTTAGVVSQLATASILVTDTLRVLKSITPSSPTKVAPGNPVNYSVTVQNWTNAVISNAVITDTLSNSQTFVLIVVPLVLAAPPLQVPPAL